MLLLIAGAAAVYLIGNGSVALWDRDEPRYAQTSRQMLESGDWVVPRLLDQVRTAKPVFIYWCQAATMAALGGTVFAARLPSAIAMMLTLVVLAAVIDRIAGTQRAFWTVLIFASSGLVIAAAKMCITDAVLLLWVTTAQFCLLSTYLRHKVHPPPPAVTAEPFVMWIAIGLAGLTKGPVVLGVQITTLLALAALDVGRNWRSGAAWRDAIRWWLVLRPLSGAIIVAAICGPWLYLIHQREPTFLPQTLGHDVWTRMRTPLEGHKGPPGFYLLTIWGTYFPWSLLLPATIVSAWRRRNSFLIRFSLAAVVGPWILFEIVQTKLVHYVLPMFPFLAILTADMLIRSAHRKTGDLSGRAFLAPVRGWFVVVALLGLLPWLALARFELPLAALIAMSLSTVLAIAYGGSVMRGFTSGQPRAAAAVMGIGMMLIVAVLHGLYFPNATFFQTSQRVAAVLRAEGAVKPGDAIMIDYKEDSLAFYQGGTIRRERENEFLLTHRPDQWPRWIVLTDRIWRTLPESTRDEFDVVDTVRGLWYVKGSRVVDVLVLRKK